MKRRLSLLIALMLLLAPAALSEGTQQLKGTGPNLVGVEVAIEYDLSESFTVTIPDGDVTLGGLYSPTQLGTVMVKNLRLKPGSTLRVKMHSLHNFQVVRDGTDAPQLDYTLAATGHFSGTWRSNQEAEEKPLVEIKAGNSISEAGCMLNLTLQEPTIVVGSYSDRLTFTVDVEYAVIPVD